MNCMKWILIVDLVLVNSLLGWLFYKSQKPIITQNSINKTEYIDKCGTDCQKYIDAKMIFPKPSPTTITKTVYQTITKPKTKSIVYVPITGTGSTTNNDWTSLSGTDFYFDKNDYPGLVEVSFEANLRLFNGNGMAYVRLFDVTHGIAAQSSDTQTNSQTSIAINSGAINFWSGKNLYRVQVKSLTADTAIFDGGKLKIILEQ